MVGENDCGVWFGVGLRGAFHADVPGGLTSCHASSLPPRASASPLCSHLTNIQERAECGCSHARVT